MRIRKSFVHLGRKVTLTLNDAGQNLDQEIGLLHLKIQLYPTMEDTIKYMFATISTELERSEASLASVEMFYTVNGIETSLLYTREDYLDDTGGWVSFTSPGNGIFDSKRFKEAWSREMGEYWKTMNSIATMSPEFFINQSKEDPPSISEYTQKLVEEGLITQEQADRTVRYWEIAQSYPQCACGQDCECSTKKEGE